MKEWNEYPFFVMHDEATYEGPDLAIWDVLEMNKDEKELEDWLQRDNVAELGEATEAMNYGGVFRYDCEDKSLCLSYHNAEACRCVREVFSKPSEWRTYNDGIMKKIFQDLEIDNEQIHKDT